MTFEENVQKWVCADNQIKLYLEKVRELRTKRNDMTDTLLTYAENQQLENPIIEISDGRLKFQQTKITSPLTYRFVESCLHECIGNSEHVASIIQYIKSKRSSRIVPDIKRFYNKNN